MKLEEYQEEVYSERKCQRSRMERTGREVLMGGGLEEGVGRRAELNVNVSRWAKEGTLRQQLE